PRAARRERRAARASAGGGTRTRAQQASERPSGRPYPLSTGGRRRQGHAPRGPRLLAASALATVAAVCPKSTFRASSSSAAFRRSSSPTARPFLTAGRPPTVSHQRATFGKSASTLRP